MNRNFLALIMLITLWVLWPWEWSLLDDTGIILSLSKHISSSGLFYGWLHNIAEFATNDRGWGLFRPGWWVYASTIYLFPTQIAYTLRLLMVLTILIVPLKLFHKSHHKTLALCVLLSNRPLYLGLTHLSLQEVCGLFSLALGLGSLSLDQKNRKQAMLPNLFFITACLFKAPFVWFLLTFNFFQLKNKGRTAVFSLIAGVILVATFFIYAKGGSYTSRMTVFEFSKVLISLDQLYKPAAYMILIISIFSFSERKFLSTFRIRDLVKSDQSLLFLSLALGGLLYLANLLPWAAHGYYFSPPIFMIGLGLFGVVANNLEKNFKQNYYAKTIYVIAGFVVLKGLFQVYYKNSDVIRIRDWALSLPRENVVIGVNDSEAAVRLNQLMTLRSSLWKNEFFALSESEQSPKIIHYYLAFDERAKNPLYCKNTLLRFLRSEVCATGN